RPISSHDVVERAVVAAGRLAVGEKNPVAVWESVTDGEVVVDVAAIRGNGAATDTDCALRRLILHDPHDLVGVVHGLLDQAVAAEPREVVPVANLPLDVAHARGARAFRRYRLDRICVVGR